MADPTHDSSGQIIRPVKPVLGATPTIYNVDVTLADTEYSQALPASTRKFTVKLRDGTAFRLAFVTGKVAGPTAPWLTINDGLGYSEDNVDLAGLTVYVASAVAGKVAEIVAWV